ncbi:hypothetical protein H3H36_19255 [Duganella sp. FT3S]|uniref:Uncharacterized protein n=1 Tax=Rugamonas fusca TaxID=2758568 RepID=A0A7W2EKE7_9BURK|nr:hypothetical protein [Rugamonas fusca]MBA5607499.1 hypothetical protein [Rugamonas fusca]
MKPSVKAALWSGLVFPGLGHMLALRRPLRGCLFLLPTALGWAYLLGGLLPLVNTLSEQLVNGTLAPDPDQLAQRVAESGMGGAGPGVVLLVCTVCWIGSVVDSFLAGAAPRP